MLYNLIISMRDWLEETDLWRFLQVFRWAEFRMLCAMILTFLTVIGFGKPTIRLLMQMKIGDNPEFYNADLNRLTKQKAATPTMGGVLIAGSILTATLLLADLTNFYVIMGIICLLVLAAIGMADDWLKLTAARRSPGSREGLYSWEKLLFQLGLAVVLAVFVYRHGGENAQTHVLSLPFQRTLDPSPTGQWPLAEGLYVMGPWAFCILGVLVIVGTSNAVNLTDGMDGLASGVMGIISFAFIILILITGSQTWARYMLMPHVQGSEELAVIAGGMAGACFGFLWWNCNPAQVFMGDTGSLPLGGLVGYIAMVIRAETLLFVIGGVLVMEAVSVILQVGYFKFTKGSRLFKCTPIHHHFHLSGWTEPQVVVRFWLITAMLAAVAIATLKLR